MRDLEFKIKQLCMKEGAKIKIKNDSCSYTYLGIENVEDEHGNVTCKRILRSNNHTNPQLKIMDNTYFIENVSLDLSPLGTLEELQSIFEEKLGYSNDPKMFYKNYISFKEHYNKLSDRDDKNLISEVYKQYEENFKKSVLDYISKDFEHNKDTVNLISSLVLDIIFESFFFQVIMQENPKK